MRASFAVFLALSACAVDEPPPDDEPCRPERFDLDGATAVAHRETSLCDGAIDDEDGVVASDAELAEVCPDLDADVDFATERVVVVDLGDTYPTNGVTFVAEHEGALHVGFETEPSGCYGVPPERVVAYVVVPAGDGDVVRHACRVQGQECPCTGPFCPAPP